ncbi:hypothetical protein [Canibacter oris]|uniref:Type III secretory pathway component EscS n=1 Tax=Canibacter oris TaxID=1365628 RepID=A0A840DDF8_9MICO|nr:hypothetical protein [Canibacter oris]MBB4071491.1 type III secretory pathway component EscS [Canibacter oris]
MRQTTLERIVFAVAPVLCLLLSFVLPLSIVSSLVLFVVCGIWLLRSRYYSSSQKILLLSFWLVAAGATVGFFYSFGEAVTAADTGALTATTQTLPWVFAALAALIIIVNLFYGLLLRQQEAVAAAS